MHNVNVCYKNSIPREVILSHVFGMAILSIFLPIKIYPLMFFISISFMLWKTKIKFHFFVFFALCFLLLSAFSILHVDIDSDVLTSLVKLSLGIAMMVCCAIFSISGGRSIAMLEIIHKYLSVIIMLCLVQVVILHAESGGVSIIARDSYIAGMIFNSKYAVFGGEDKNMFGAKVALFGLAQYILHSYLYKKGANLWLGIIFLAGLLSMSRTPVAFVLATVALYKVASRRGFMMKLSIFVTLLVVFAISSPYIIDYLRISSIDQGKLSDGMSIRLLYWAAVLNNIDLIGFFGQGLLSAREFLPIYSEYYNGEPNVHNLYLNTFLDLGFTGITIYILMILSLFSYLKHLNGPLAFVIISASFIMSCTLYTAYDIEMWCFLSLSIFMLRLIKSA